MADALGKAETIDLLRRHGMLLDRRRGQHFLVEPNIVRRIVEIAGCGRGDRVLEVGPGAGTLTRQLAATGASVVAYEIDETLRPILDEVLSGAGDVEVRYADATAVDLDHALGAGEWMMVANLPYNVGAPLLLDALRGVPRLTRFVVMLQKEAVERLTAGPGSRRYGIPSVVAGLHARARVALRVPGHVFTPPTPVASAVVVLDRIEPDELAERAIALATAAFGQRRKMLRSALRGTLADPEAVLTAAGLPPSARAEDLAPDDYLALARSA
jgi:16S rRNA (adenine1518-N6/adenine1519-N6)-dimethyltransferase